MGRTTKLNSDTQAKICKAIAGGNFYRAACALADVDYVNFWRWLKRGEKEDSGLYRNFRNAVREAQAQAEATIVTEWREQIPHDWRAARDFLARRFPDRWGPKERHEITGAKGEPLVLNITEEVVDARTQAG